MPLLWRPVLTQIANRRAHSDYALLSRPANVSAVDENLARFIGSQIERYGDELSLMPEESWERAVYLWAGDRWEVLLDLCTKREGVSDLGLFVNVLEAANDFLFEVQSVHVP